MDSRHARATIVTDLLNCLGEELRKPVDPSTAAKISGDLDAICGNTCAGVARESGATIVLPVIHELLASASRMRGGYVSLRVYFKYLRVVADDVEKELSRGINLAGRLGDWRGFGRLQFVRAACRWHIGCLYILGARYWCGVPPRSGPEKCARISAAILSRI